jgi:DNA-binding NarL/FixJ family response regulator
MCGQPEDRIVISRLQRVGRSAGVKPRVLLVDDHKGVLDKVSSTLSDTFDVVGVATDGRQALEMARHLDPDAIVLDINMPGFNGFETMRALERTGSRAAVVFLSLIHDDDYVCEAFRLGGRGYVVKSRMLSDLPTALDQALLGRRFAPSLPALLQISSGGTHAMLAHDDEDSFVDAVGPLLDLALHRGDATGLIGTEHIRDGVTAYLQARGWDVGPSGTLRRYRVFDTHAALDGLMRDGLPDATRLAAIVEELDEYRRTVCTGPSSRITIAGNLAAPLMAEGNAAGVLAIERLWDTLTKGRPFFSVCGYSTSCFHDHASDGWSTLTNEHSAVCLGSGV